MIHLSIPGNQTSINFDNEFPNALPNLVVVSLVSDGHLSGSYQTNKFYFRNFGLHRI